MWRQKIEPYINAHNLTEFVVCSRISSQFADDEARVLGTVNHDYTCWLQKDQMLLSWLQSTLSSEILSRVLGCIHAHHLWDRLFSYFQKQTRARVRQLCVELRALTLENSIVQEYLLKIRNIVDALAPIGDPIPCSHHIDIILEGLPSEFTPVISFIESKFGLMDLDEVEILLLAHELRLTTFKKQSPPDLVSLNLTYTSSHTEDSNSFAPDPVPLVVEQGSETDFHHFRCGRGLRGGHSGRSRSGRFSTMQCQVCSKVGHLALNCWHKFNQQF